MHSIVRSWRRLAQLCAIVVTITLTHIALVHPAQAYDYNYVNIDDVSVESTDVTAGANSDLAVTFTMPFDMSTSGYFYLYSPTLYSYSGGTYTSEYVDMTNASFDSDELTYSYHGSTYVGFYPKNNLTSGQTVTLAVTNVTNPATLEGSGTFYVYLSEYGDTVYNYAYGNDSIVYGTVDLTVKLTTSTGTPVSDVSVSLYWSDPSNWYSYDSKYATTDENGNAQFTSMTADRAYTIYFSYSGNATDQDVPTNTTYTYNGTANESVTYKFSGKNVTTHFLDSDGNAVNNAYWYFYKTNYTNYTTDYVSRWGYTDSTGKISGSAPTDGDYMLYVYDANWSSYNFPFSVSGGVSDLDDPIAIPEPEVTGTVTAGGSAASSVYMYMYNQDWTIYRYGYTTSSGAFQFALGQTGTYTLVVSNWSVPSGYFAPDPMEISVTGGVPNDPLNITLTRPSKTISGTVTKKSDATAGITAGTPVTDGYVYASQAGSWNYVYASTDSNGTFSMNVPGGGWNIYLYQQSWPATWAYTGETLYAEFTDDEVEETATFSIEVLPYNSTITGTVVYPDSTPVGANSVYVYAYGGANNNVYSYGYTDANGVFDLNVTEGTFTMYMWFYDSNGSNKYAVPSLDSVTVENGATADMGQISLLEKNSHIQGRVSIRSTGDAVNSQYIYAYRSDGGWDWASATTDTSGNYDMYVSAGDWMVYTYTYGLLVNGKNVIYAGGPQSVSVAENETVSGIDFLFDIADANATFNAVDNSGNLLSNEFGWASIYEDTGGDYGWYSTGCYVSSGTCSVPLASGVAYSINYYSYGNWYASSDEDTYTYVGPKVNNESVETVTLESEETKTIDLAMAINDVTVTGQFLDQNGDPVDTYGGVYASNGSNGWAYAYIYYGSSYTLKLAAGTWHIGFYSWSEMVNESTSQADVTVASGDSITQDFYLLDSNATVSGTVLDPNGDEVTTPTFVRATTTYGNACTDTCEIYGLIEQTTYTDETGVFSMSLPEGQYYVTASSPDYLDPTPVLVTADDSGSAENITLQFTSADATISGTVTDGIGLAINNRRSLAVGDGVANAFVYGYTSTGSSFNISSDSDGTYTLPATRDIWYVGAARQIENSVYYALPQEVDATGGDTTLNIVLTETYAMPAPATVQFDPNEAEVITLDNDFTVNIPANAITSENLDSVTVTVTPTWETAYESDTQPVAESYDINATDENGNPITELSSSITIEIPASENVDTTELETTRTGYYNESADSWENQTSVYDEENGEYVITTNHFSAFGIVSGRSVVAENPEIDDGGDEGSIGTVTTPTNVKVKNRAAKNVMVDWANADNATSYEVDVINKKTGTSVKTVSSTQSKKTIKKLTSNKSYEFRVRSVGNTGSTSGWSNAVSGRTLPATPKIKSVRGATVKATSAVARWKKSRGTVKNYLVTVYLDNGTKVKTIKTKKTRVTLTSLKANTGYYVKVRARFNKRNTSAYSKKQAFHTSAL